jgi:hypothetical protein
MQFSLTLFRKLSKYPLESKHIEEVENFNGKEVAIESRHTNFVHLQKRNNYYN